VAVVRQWLVEGGIAEARIAHSDNKGWFAFHATAEEAESLLQTEYHEYEDTESGGIMPACEAYHVPKHLQVHIDYISPGIKLLAPTGQLRKRLQTRSSGGPTWSGPTAKFHKPSWPIPENSSDLSTCDIAITPACVAALYDIPPARFAHPSNSMGIFESELQFYTQDDLNNFFTNFTSYIPNGTHPIAADIDGGVQSTTNLSLAGGEADLDLELAYPIVYPQTITIYQVDDLLVQANPNDTYTFGFNTFLDALDGVSWSTAFGRTYTNQR
jgi:tripeptidyl-peptidase-1